MGDIILVDPVKAKILWSYELGAPVSGNPAVVKNKIIVGTEDGYLYCFGKK